MNDAVTPTAIYMNRARELAAICWDHDGLLVDTESVFFAVTRDLFAEASVLLSRETWSREYLLAGRGSADIARDLGIADARLPTMIEERNRRYKDALRSSVPFRPHADALVRSLAGTCRMALVTGSHRSELETIHSRTGFLSLFETIVTREAYARSKPAPDPYLCAAERLGLAPAQCIAVEDSGRGLASATSAGMRCIVVPNDLTAGQNFDTACAVAADLLEAAPYLRREPG